MILHGSKGQVSFDGGETWHPVTDLQWEFSMETRGGLTPQDWKIAGGGVDAGVGEGDGAGASGGDDAGGGEDVDAGVAEDVAGADPSIGQMR
jgi:hypothetical protein